MILVVIGVCIAAMVVGSFIDSICYGDLGETIGTAIAVVGGIGLVVAIIAAITLCVSVSKSGVIDERIAMYAEENANIEQQITAIVNEYKEYESDTLSDLKPESMIMLTTVYPELKANELVQTQLAIHIGNNEKIKQLKEEKLCSDVYRWWLYFGGGDSE
jgi:hypothetical protein